MRLRRGALYLLHFMTEASSMPLTELSSKKGSDASASRGLGRLGQPGLRSTKPESVRWSSRPAQDEQVLSYGMATSAEGNG